MKKLIDPFGVAIVGMLIGTVMWFVSVPYSNHLPYVAGLLVGGMLVSAGMISLAILKAFDKDK